MTLPPHSQTLPTPPESVSNAPGTTGKKGKVKPVFVPLPEPLVLEVKYPVPTINRILEMNPWERFRERVAIQRAVLSALRLAAADSQTRTACMRNHLSMLADTLQRFIQMRRTRRNSKLNRSRLKPRLKKRRGLKSFFPALGEKKS